jgi:uncharacterized membrane protein YkvA (DUF1232 family)
MIKPTSLPESLDRFLRTSTDSASVSLAEYFAQGVTLVTSEAIAALRDRLPGVRSKLATIRDSDRLVARLELLTLYFEETLGLPGANQTARQEITFALLYFLKGFDRIPDSIPEIGLLDDAMIVETALNRNLTALRHHWIQRGRPWPAQP